MAKKNSQVDPRYAKTEQYKKDMGEIVSEGVCPLCPPLKWHRKPILKDDGRWFITENSHPYQNAKHHLVIISKKHIERLPELTLEDLKSILNLSKWAAKKLGIKGGGLTMRFGETLYTGATVKHLHAHLIVPKADGDQASPVYFPIG